MGSKYKQNFRRLWLLERKFTFHFFFLKRRSEWCRQLSPPCSCLCTIITPQYRHFTEGTSAFVTQSVSAKCCQTSINALRLLNSDFCFFSHFPAYMPLQHTFLFIQLSNLSFLIIFLNYPLFLLHMPQLYSLKTAGGRWDV